MKFLSYMMRGLVAVLIASGCGLANAEERLYGSFIYNSDIPNALFFMDEIKNGDDFELRKALRNHDIDTIVLASPGGSVWAGLSMAGIIFDKKLRVYVPPKGICASACSFMFFGGNERLSEGELGVHQFASSDPSKTANAVKTQAQSQFTVSEIIGFLNEFDTPRFVLERMFEDREMYWFNGDETKLLNSAEFTLGDVEKSSIVKFATEKIDSSKNKKIKNSDYSEKELIALIQKRLNELGCNAGIADGIWGKRSNAAAIVFAKKAGLPTSNDSLISEAFFDALVNAPAGFCPKPKPKPKPKTSANKAPATDVASPKSNIVYECERILLVADGFVDRVAADSWFPKETWLVYRPDGSFSASMYGTSAKRTKNDIKFGRSTTRNSGGETIVIRHENRDRQKSKISISISWPGYKPTMPTTYKCGPSKKTDWWP